MLWGFYRLDVYSCSWIRPTQSTAFCETEEVRCLFFRHPVFHWLVMYKAEYTEILLNFTITEVPSFLNIGIGHASQPRGKWDIGGGVECSGCFVLLVTNGKTRNLEQHFQTVFQRASAKVPQEKKEELRILLTPTSASLLQPEKLNLICFIYWGFMNVFLWIKKSSAVWEKNVGKRYVWNATEPTESLRRGREKNILPVQENESQQKSSS